MARFTTIVAIALALAACGQPAAPTPVDPNSLVTPGEHSGPVAIDFVSATVTPGGTIAGCGARIEGCRDRLRMTFRLRPTFAGPVLFSRVYLHAANQVACLWGETGFMTLQAGVPATLEMPANQVDADHCGVPLDILTMDVVVDGPTEIESRQVWAIHYHFVP